jgi:hypothetical protein
MLKIVTSTDTLGPFRSVVKQDDHFLVDGTIFPINVIGDGTIEEWTDPIPEPEIPDIAYENARKKRDDLIAQSDWRVIRAADTGVAMSQEWIDYRQALRDVPAQDGFPRNIVWPSEPE